MVIETTDKPIRKSIAFDLSTDNIWGMFQKMYN